ncbi:Transmembrane protein 45B [Bienertia sinuspersici]
MGGREGHICLGLVFLIIGLWHLYNQLKNNAILKCYKSLPWFPASFSRYLELYLIIFGCSTFILSELHSSPFDHHDGTILATHLHHIEHASIAMTFLLHALFAILLDKTWPNTKAHISMGHFFAAMAFAQELLLFHFHSTDHVGLEGQYHLLLQQVVLVCLFSTLLNIWLPKSFMMSFIRSLGVIFQGLWLIVMGYMLWTPDFAPKGCLMKKGHYGRYVIKCDDHGSLDRGKALVNILFSWFLIGMVAFGVACYLVVNKVYGVNEFLEDDDGEEMTCQMEDRQKFLYRSRVLPFDLEE